MVYLTLLRTRPFVVYLNSPLNTKLHELPPPYFEHNSLVVYPHPPLNLTLCDPLILTILMMFKAIMNHCLSVERVWMNCIVTEADLFS